MIQQDIKWVASIECSFDISTCWLSSEMLYHRFRLLFDTQYSTQFNVTCDIIHICTMSVYERNAECRKDIER